MGVLAATEQIPAGCLENAVFVGELSLDGSLRHVRGVLSFAFMTRELGCTTLYVPECDAPEAGLVDGIDIIPVPTLGHLVEQVFQLSVIPPLDRSKLKLPPEQHAERIVDFADVKGQEYVKRAMEIVAAGGHHALMSGPPGSGKTLIARALPGILPKLVPEEALEITRIYSVADKLPPGKSLAQRRPFRAPHHTISQVCLHNPLVSLP